MKPNRLTFVLILATTLLLSACGKQNNSAASAENQTQARAATAPVTVSAEVKAAGPKLQLLQCNQNCEMRKGGLRLICLANCKNQYTAAMIALRLNPNK